MSHIAVILSNLLHILNQVKVMGALWIDDMNELARADFWPDPDTTQAEQINAVSRFVMLSSGIISYHRENYRIILAGVVCAVAVQIYGRKLTQESAIPSRQVEEEIIEGTNKLPEATLGPRGDKEMTEMADNRDEFAHFAYGDINNNAKLKGY